MEDTIGNLMNKPACGSEEMRLARNKAVTLQELNQLRGKLGCGFIINDANELDGEYNTAFCENILVTVVGPPIRRSLRYRKICIADIDGHEAFYELSRLPPITLKFQLGANYPKDPNFVFWFDSAWLPSDMLDLLSERLSSLISEIGQGSSLQSCCGYLQDEALSFMFGSEKSNGIEINTFQLFENKEDRMHAVELLVGFEEDMRDVEFEKKTHECPICFEEFQGTECVRFITCEDVVCVECANRSFTTNINDGKNSGLPLCPTCGVAVIPVEIKRVVSDEVYATFESRLLNRTLSGMKDIVECPKEGCKYEHVMLERDFSHGVCTSCRFHFCALCRTEFHEDTPCKTGPISNLSPNELNELMQRYNNAGPDGRTQLELEYGKLNIQKLSEELATNNFVGTNCKSCPSCQSPIQKNGGCNRILCLTCRANFCWICLAVMDKSNPYEHFNSSDCPLWK